MSLKKNIKTLNKNILLIPNLWRAVYFDQVWKDIYIYYNYFSTPIVTFEM